MFDWAENKDGWNRQAIGKKFYNRKKRHHHRRSRFITKTITYLQTMITFDRETAQSHNQPCSVEPKIKMVGIDKQLVRNFPKEKNLNYHRRSLSCYIAKTYMQTMITFDRETAQSHNQPCSVEPKIKMVEIDKQSVRNFPKEKNRHHHRRSRCIATKMHLPADDDSF